MLQRKYVGAGVGAVLLGLSLQAEAIEVNPYATIRVGAFWSHTNAYQSTTGAKKSDQDFSLDNFGDSFAGFRAKEGDFSFVGELGLYNPKAYSKGPEVRLMFGEWDFGGGKLRIGKAPSPYVYRTQQVWDSDGGMNGYGSLWDGRYAQIKVTMDNGLYVGLMQPRVGNSGNNTSNISPNADVLAAYSQTGNAYATNYANYNTRLPKIVLGYEGKAGVVTYGGGAAYNYYNLKTVTAANGTPVIAGAPNVDEDIHSYLLFFHGNVNLVPVDLSWNIFTGRNVGDLMSTATGNGTANTLANPGAANGAYFDVVRGINSYTYGGWGQVGWTVNGQVKVYAGASYVRDDNRVAKPDERMASFANVQFQVNKRLKIVPEIDYVNDLNNSLGQKEPIYLAAGAKLEMTF